MKNPSKPLSNPAGKKVRRALPFLAASVIVVFLCQPAESATIYRFQQGVWNGLDEDTDYMMDDAGLRGNDTTVNSDGNTLANLTSIRTGSAGTGGWSIIYRFDISAVPETLSNPTATFQFTLDPNNVDRDYQWILYQVPQQNSTWTSSTATYANQDQDEEVAWINSSGDNAVNVRPAVISGGVIGTTGITFLSGVSTLNISITDSTLIENWITLGEAMFYLEMVNLGAGTGFQADVRTSSNSTLEVRPMLSIIPEPGGAGLLALGGLLVLLHRRFQRRRR